MKTVKLIATVILASMMALSASAANFVPSREAYVPGIVEGDDMYIIFDKDDERATDEIIENLTEAEEDLTGNELKDLVPDFADKWEDATGGAPLENGGITNIFEIVVPNNQTGEGEKIEAKFTVNEITKDDKFVIVGNNGDGWTVVDYTIDENNVITIVFDPTGDNTFAIIVDTTAEPVPGGDSPQTGVAVYSVSVIACAAVLCGVAYVVIRKAAKSRNAA